MYIVVSRWQPQPGKEEEFDQLGRKMRKLLKQQPGVMMVEGFFNDSGEAIAIHGYEDEAAYQRIVHDPNGFFAKASEEQNIDSVGRWISSDRGQAQE